MWKQHPTDFLPRFTTNSMVYFPPLFPDPKTRNLIQRKYQSSMVSTAISPPQLTTARHHSHGHTTTTTCTVSTTTGLYINMLRPIVTCRFVYNTEYRSKSSQHIRLYLSRIYILARSIHNLYFWHFAPETTPLYIVYTDTIYWDNLFDFPFFFFIFRFPPFPFFAFVFCEYISMSNNDNNNNYNACNNHQKHTTPTHHQHHLIKSTSTSSRKPKNTEKNNWKLIKTETQRNYRIL